MKNQIRYAILTLVFCTFHAKIMRNNALMTKMINHFAIDNNLSSEANIELDKEIHVKPREKKKFTWREKQIKREKGEIHDKLEEYTQQDRQRRPEKVLNIMQNVLCKNFPTIPCKIIMEDPALSKLIEKSIQQIASKKQQIGITKRHNMEQVGIKNKRNKEQQHQPTTVASPRGFSPLTTTLYPVINSEELSNFLQVSNTGYFHEDQQEKKAKKKKKFDEKKVKNRWSHESPSKKKLKGGKDSKHGTELFTGRKKMRKFYPHKIKYKDKAPATINDGNYREDPEKASMSADFSDTGIMGLLNVPKSERLKFKFGPSDTPVWRIDYEKHGVPSMNMFEFDDNRKPESGLIHVNSGGAEHSIVRKEVMHPDVYLKKIIRKPAADIYQ
ncbi:hypothetical protein O0L34_g1783 [Tuta absoluta]|nr:hypothetical protein O0L34_g1783 [Tuta absoluta]